MCDFSPNRHFTNLYVCHHVTLFSIIRVLSRPSSVLIARKTVAELKVAIFDQLMMHSPHGTVAHACLVILMATVCLPAQLISYSRPAKLEVESMAEEGDNFITMLVIILLLSYTRIIYKPRRGVGCNGVGW